MPQRKRIPIEHRERIVRAFEDEAEDYLLVADTLGVNRSTARGIAARYIRKRRIRERPRGGLCRNIARNLEGMLFRVKLVRPVPADRNRPGILQRRQEYGN